MTLGGSGRTQLRTLCDVIGCSADLERATALFDLLGETWAERPVAAPPAFPSDITDDHSPYEFSLALDGARPELRVLTEATGASGTLAANWEAAMRLSERLEQRHGASLARAHRITDLFRPRRGDLRFAAWHAVSLNGPGAAPDIKLYLNPDAAGVEKAPALTEEALRRLGLARAFAWVARYALRRGARDRLVYFSLDLSDQPEARVKVYVALEEATPGDVEAAMCAVPGQAPGEAGRTCVALAGGEGPYRARPIILSLAFVAGEDTQPTAVALHVPVRCYAEDDLAVVRRVRPFLSKADADLYQRVVTGLGGRPLDAGVGLQTYASVRHYRGRDRLTAYLSPELYAVTPPRRS
jgi:hypothetical protein